MEQSTLQEILGVERQLREELDVERQRANAWLEAERRGIDAAHVADLARIRREGEQAQAAARVAATAAAATIVQQAARHAQSVAQLGDDELRCRVAACLEEILPEADRAR